MAQKSLQKEHQKLKNGLSQGTSPFIRKLSLDVLEEQSEQEEDGGDKQTYTGFYKSSTTAETLTKVNKDGSNGLYQKLQNKNNQQKTPQSISMQNKIQPFNYLEQQQMK